MARALRWPYWRRSRFSRSSAECRNNRARAYFSTSQLVFAGLISLLLYGSFVFVQTVRHRDYFLPVKAGDDEAHAAPPSNATALVSAGVLVAALVAIVGLAKALTPTVEVGVASFGASEAVVGIVIATLVLLPEGLAALRARRPIGCRPASILLWGRRWRALG